MFDDSRVEFSPLIRLVYEGELTALVRHIRFHSWDLRRTSSDGQGLLGIAAKVANPEIVSVLLQAGLCPSEVDGTGMSALDVARIRVSQISDFQAGEILSLLIEADQSY